MVNAEDVFARMTRAAFAAVDALGDAPRQCVVRASQIQDNDAFGISGRLLFAGLRGVQVTGHDEAVYVAAAEDCALVAKFAAAAFNNLHGLAPALIACPSATLYTCGDP